MAYGLGLGKPRTRLGRWLDVNGLTQRWLENNTGLGENTLIRLCNDKNYSPSERTKITIVAALRKVDSDVTVADFW